MQQLQYKAPNLMYGFQNFYRGDTMGPTLVMVPRIINHSGPFSPKSWLHG